MKFNELLQLFSTKLGVLIPKANQQGYYAFDVKKDFQVFLFEEIKKNQFYLSSVVCIPPLEGKDRKAILSICLEANLFAQGTNGATFAFNRATQELIFFRTFTTKRASFPIFLNALNDMHFHVTQWRLRFEAKDYYGSWRQGFRGLRETDIQAFWTKV